VDDEILGADGTSTDCAICLDQLQRGETVTTLPCKHLFHEACVTLWLRQHNTCPICRAPLEQTSASVNSSSSPDLWNSGPRDDDPVREGPSVDSNVHDSPTSRTSGRRPRGDNDVNDGGFDSTPYTATGSSARRLVRRTSSGRHGSDSNDYPSSNNNNNNNYDDAWDFLTQPDRSSPGPSIGRRHRSPFETGAQGNDDVDDNDNERRPRYTNMYNAYDRVEERFGSYTPRRRHSRSPGTSSSLRTSPRRTGSGSSRDGAEGQTTSGLGSGSSSGNHNPFTWLRHAMDRQTGGSGSRR
jgi:hypothetical protein